MKFVTIAFILCTILVASSTQIQIGPNVGVGIGGVGGFPSSDFFLTILRLDAQQLQARPGGLPDDLNQHVEGTLLNAESAFNACNTNAPSTLPWIQIRCISVQLKISKSELKAIEDEANARDAAASAATNSPTAGAL